MIKRLKFAFFLWMLVVFSVGSTSVSVFAESFNSTDMVYFCDEGNKLSATEFETVFLMLEETAEETQMHIGVWIGSTAMGEYATESFCDETYDDTFGINTDGIFLYLDCSEETDLYDYISTSGSGQFYYTNSEEYDRISAMWDDMDAYLSRGNEDIPGAITAFCDDIIYYAAIGAPSNTYYTYNDDTNEYLYLQDGEMIAADSLPVSYRLRNISGTMLLILIGISLAVSAIVLLMIRKKYRFKEAENISFYLQDNKVQFTLRTDRFIGQHRTRTRINTDHGGGAGGGGHSHSSFGGGSHGGGGHHR